MSNYTTEIRFICESANEQLNGSGYNNLSENIQAGRAAIFDFDYPIFDPEYKSVLESKILMHYYTREISEETVGLWKLRLNARMNEIMPFYNKMYESELLAFNPFWDTDYTRSGNRAGEENKQDNSITKHSETDAMTGDVQDNRTTAEDKQNILSSTENTTVKNTGSETHNVSSNSSEEGAKNTNNRNDHWDFYSDTPQGTIGFIPGSTGEPQAVDELEDQTYLTNVRHVTDNSAGSQEINNSSAESSGIDTLTLNTENSTEAVSGKDQSEHKEGTDTNKRVYNTANERSGNNTTDTTGNATSTEEYMERVQGKMGGVSYAKLLKEFRETFLNIDMMIIDNLADLFFGLWG